MICRRLRREAGSRHVDVPLQRRHSNVPDWIRRNDFIRIGRQPIFVVGKGREGARRLNELPDVLQRFALPSELSGLERLGPVLLGSRHHGLLRMGGPASRSPSSVILVGAVLARLGTLEPQSES